MKTIEYPNGQTATYGYNALNRLTDLAWVKGANPTYRYHYDLYADGQRAAVQEYAAGAQTPTAAFTWTYDNLNRLTQEVFDGGSGDYTHTYTYDLAGNRKTKAVAGGATTYYFYTENFKGVRSFFYPC